MPPRTLRPTKLQKMQMRHRAIYGPTVVCDNCDQPHHLRPEWSWVKPCTNPKEVEVGVKLQPKTLKAAKLQAVRKAYGDLIGASCPFSAVDWMKTLPKEWQEGVDRVIAHVYHHETNPPKEMMA